MEHNEYSANQSKEGNTNCSKIKEINFGVKVELERDFVETNVLSPESNIRTTRQSKNSLKIYTCKFCGLETTTSKNLKTHKSVCELQLRGNRKNSGNHKKVQKDILQESDTEDDDDVEHKGFKAKKPKTSKDFEPEPSSSKYSGNTEQMFKLSVDYANIKQEPIEFNSQNFENSTYDKNDSPKVETILIKSEPVDDDSELQMNSFALQCAIINKMHKGRTINEICKQYNVKPDYVNEVWDKRDSIFAVSHTDRKMSRLMNKQVEESLLEWYNEQKKTGVTLTGKMLLDAAEKFANECGFLTFNGDLKWLERFKKKYNILLRATPVKREPYSGEFGGKWKENFFKDLWPELRGGFADEDIFCADEIGVFFNSSNGRIIRNGGKKYIHGYPEERLAIFMCTNLTGSEKKKLIVCGTHDPLSKTTRKPETLPVTYIRNKYSHFTTSIFESLVKDWDKKLEKDKRRAILILDRASIHTKLTTLNLKLVFIPWKASSVLMPIKNGISSAFMSEYRKLILLNKSHNVMRGLDRNITCLEALEMISKAWVRVTAAEIKKSFVLAGFEPINEYPKIDNVELPKFSQDEQATMIDWIKEFDVEPHFKDLSKLELYLTAEDEILTDQGTHSSAFGGNRKARLENSCVTDTDTEILPIATEAPENDSKERFLLKTRALQDLDILKRFFEANDTKYDIYKALYEIENLVIRNPLRDT